MDLYEDLPKPAAGQDSVPLLGDDVPIVKSWAGNLIKKVKELEEKPAVSTALRPPKVKTKPKSSAALLFKPRQAALPSSSNSAIASIRTSTPTVPSGTAQTESDRETVEPIHPPPPPGNESEKEQAIEEQENCSVVQNPPSAHDIPSEFNANSSFEVADPYDPRRPNDYIKYCEERLEQKRLAKLAEENQRRMQELEQARAELERQRREAAERKDYGKLLSSAAAASAATGGGLTQVMGRGRGRGVANLPAWLTQQLADQPLSGPAEPEPLRDLVSSTPSAAPNTHKRKLSALSMPSCVVLLKNMASPEEAAADAEQLADETKQECEKYGPVRTCVVHVVEKSRFLDYPEQERVRIFVSFHRQDSAIKALRDLNGRFFGGRRIEASFFDERSFDRRQFSPETED